MKRRRRVSKGPSYRELRERLYLLGLKARRDPRSLTLTEIEELCDIVEALRPALKEEPPLPLA